MPPTHSDAFLAVHRFGLGARPGDLDDPALRADPRGWLKAQLAGAVIPPALSSQPSAVSAVARFRDSRQQGQAAKKAQKKESRAAYAEEAGRRIVAAAESPAPFVERLVRFFSDVLTVSVAQVRCLALVGPFEREVIRAGVLGRYEDLLLASTQHPAMLAYLDNIRSTGPDSRAGQRQPDAGRNENLAREVLELHSLGVAGGYTQDDVIALADMLTGWTLDLDQPGQASGARGFAFSTRRHQPGPKTLLGKRYPEGLAGGEAALRDLARHPATARHVATRMARHFVHDDPPEDVVAALEGAWLRTRGDLRAVAIALVDCDAAWAPTLQKIRRPAELLIAAVRALVPAPDALDAETRGKLLGALRGMNQMPWSAPSPEGWADTTDAWLDGDALIRRIELIDTVARRSRAWDPPEPAALASALLGTVPPALETAIQRAPDRTTGIALVLASPPFQRR